MADLTEQTEFACEQWHHYCMNGWMADRPKPSCDWDSFTCGKEVIKTKGQFFCPECGEPAIPYKVAV